VIYRKVVASLVTVLGLGLLGSVAGPGWSPRSLESTVVSQTTDVSIGGDAATTPVGTFPVRSEIIEVQLDGARIEAEITLPDPLPDDEAGGGGAESRGPPGSPSADAELGRFPAVLFMHGAGTGRHSAFRETARALASAGVVAMVPAKRLDTYTTRERDYPAMAQDYLVSFEVLRARPEVDPNRVGVYGESEGCWIAPIAAATNPHVAFLIQVSAPVVSPRQQAAFATDAYLRNVGVPRALLRAIPRGIGSHVPGGGFEYADFDVRPYQRAVTQPTLIVYGTADASMPVIQGTEIMIEDLATVGNTAYTVRYFVGANHGIRVDGVIVPEFLDVLARWTQGLPDTAHAEPRIAGAQPEQRFAAEPVERPRWYADGDMLLAGLQAGLGALVVGPVLWLLARLVRRRPGRLPPPLARWMGVLAVATVTTLVFFAVYLARVAQLALDYRTDPIFVQGGWLAVQLLGFTTVAIFVNSVARAVVAGRAGRLANTGWIGVLTIAGVHVGCLVLLVIAAYWGVFPPVLPS
jgi:dienelactone hydrolase